MGTEKDELKRKLCNAQERLLETEERLSRLEAQLAPLTKQVIDAQTGKKYLEARITKLMKMLNEK